MTQNTPDISSYKLRSTIKVLSNRQSQSRLFKTSRESKQGFTILKKEGQGQNITSFSKINGSLGKQISSFSTITGDGVSLTRTGQSAVLKEDYSSNITSRSSVSPANGGFAKFVDSRSTIAGTSASKNISSRSWILAHYIDAYTLSIVRSYPKHKESRSTIIAAPTKTILSWSAIAAPSWISGKSAIKNLNASTSSIQSQSRIVKAAAPSSVTSRSFVNNPDLLAHMDSYKVQVVITALKNITSKQNLLKTISETRDSRSDVIGTVSQTITSRSFVVYTIQSMSRIVLNTVKYAGYDDYRVVYDQDYAFYDRSRDEAISKSAVVKTAIKDITTNSSVFKTHLKDISSYSRLVKASKSDITSQSYIEGIINLAKTQVKYPYFKFDILSRATDVSVFTDSLKPREKSSKVAPLEMTPRMKPVLGVFTFDVKNRSSEAKVKVFNFSIHPNKVYKYKTGRTPVFSFDLQYRDRE